MKPPPPKKKKKSSRHDCSVNQRPNIISAKSFNQMEYVMNQYHFWITIPKFFVTLQSLENRRYWFSPGKNCSVIASGTEQKENSGIHRSVRFRTYKWQDVLRIFFKLLWKH